MANRQGLRASLRWPCYAAAALAMRRWSSRVISAGTGGLVKAYTESAQLVVNAVGRGQRVTVYEVLLAIPYNLLERVRLLVTRQRGEVLGEDFAADITMTMQFPVDNFDEFQAGLRELSAGKLQVEVIDTKEKIMAIV
jgi:putative IMPACT (imprinted ancient) family translation regulator